MRKLWQIMKMFKLPINDERIQSLTEEQIDFMIWSSILDDPERVRKLDNYFYDPDFDSEFEKSGDEDYEDESYGIEDDEVLLSSSEEVVDDITDWEEV